MKKTMVRVLLCGLAAFCSLPAATQEKFLYRERTKDVDVSTTIWEEKLPGGSIVNSSMGDGDTHKVEVDESFATQRYSFESPKRKTAYVVVREGNTLRLEGTLNGRQLLRTVPIDARPWYESLEWTLRGFVASSFDSVVFWIVYPFEAKVYLMRAHSEARESVQVNDQSMDAVRVRVGLSGIGSILWNSVYWFRPTDGEFLRSEAVRGFPGTPMTVVELVGTVPADSN